MSANSKLRLFVALALALSASSAAPGLAEEPAPAKSATVSKLPPGFEPVAGKEKKTEIDPNPLVVGAYATFFALMFIYVIYVARAQAQIAKEMRELEERMKRMEKK